MSKKKEQTGYQIHQSRMAKLEYKLKKEEEERMKRRKHKRDTE